MEIKNEFKTLLSKRMDRKDFLKHLAIGAVALVGGGALLRQTAQENQPDAVSTASTPGFGAGVYGGGGDSRAASRPRTRGTV